MNRAPYISAAMRAHCEDLLTIHICECHEAEAQDHDYKSAFDREYEALGRPQAERDRNYWSYQKELNNDHDEYGRW